MKVRSALRAALTSAIAGVLLLPALPAHAVTYNSYTLLATTPDANTAIKTQGFATIGKFAYSVKVTKDTYTKAVIHRVNVETNARQVLTNTATGNPFIGTTTLGHANGMTAADINGVRHLYVATMKDAGPHVVDLAVDGTNVTVVGQYYLTGISPASVSGISVIAASASEVQFFFKKGKNVSRGTLYPGNPTITAVDAFDIAIPPAYADFESQGFYYDPLRQVAYAPYWKANVDSVVLIYPGVTPATTGLAPVGPDKFIKDSSPQFEIEGVGLIGTKMYVNVERGGAGVDGVYRVAGFNA